MKKAHILNDRWRYISVRVLRPELLIHRHLEWMLCIQEIGAKNLEGLLACLPEELWAGVKSSEKTLNDSSLRRECAQVRMREIGPTVEAHAILFDIFCSVTNVLRDSLTMFYIIHERFQFPSGWRSSWGRRHFLKFSIRCFSKSSTQT